MAQLMRHEQPRSSRCLKPSKEKPLNKAGTVITAARTSRLLRERITGGLGTDVGGVATPWDCWLPAQIHTNIGTRAHSEPQLRLCYLPGANTPFREAAVHSRYLNYSATLEFLH